MAKMGNGVQRAKKATRGRLPLSGVRVLDLTRATGGPYGSMMLADLGAEVIKIETPELARGVSSRVQYDPDYSIKGEDAHFLALNRNKKSIVLDLQSAKGKEVFHKLTRKSDVVFNNFRPGVMKRLGVDYETLRKINPGIVFCSVTGFGSTGPGCDRPAFDLVAQAISGMMSMVDKRDADGRPAWSTVAIADLAGGIFAAYGIVAALYSRDRTGKGQEVDISLQDAMLALFMEYGLYPLNLGISRDPVARYLWGAFKTKDRYLVICAHRDGFWRNLCRGVGHEEWITDPRFDSLSKRMVNKEGLWSLIEEALAAKTAGEWMQILGKADVPCALVNSIEEGLADPQAAYRNMVPAIGHPSGGQVKIIGNPVKMSEIRSEAFALPPGLGQHTQDILKGLLGYSDEEINELRTQKVI